MLISRALSVLCGYVLVKPFEFALILSKNDLLVLEPFPDICRSSSYIFTSKFELQQKLKKFLHENLEHCVNNYLQISICRKLLSSFSLKFHSR